VHALRGPPLFGLFLPLSEQEFGRQPAGLSAVAHGAVPGRHRGGLPGRLRPAGRSVGERAALDVLHHHERIPVVLPDLVDLDDVRVPQLGDHLTLGQQPGPDLGLGAGVRAGEDHLERDGRVQLGLPGLVHDPHAAAAEFAEDLVARDPRRGRLGRRRAPRPRVVGRGPRLVEGPDDRVAERIELPCRRLARRALLQVTDDLIGLVVGQPAEAERDKQALARAGGGGHGRPSGWDWRDAGGPVTWPARRPVAYPVLREV
jgi:hypothetical protein